MLIRKYEKLIGETLRDPYGRCLGTVVGFTTNSKNKISRIALEYGNGEFAEHSVEQLIMNNGLLILKPNWKIDAEELRHEMEVSKRRMSALENLYAAGKVSARTYQELSEEYRKALKCQEDERERLINTLQGRNAVLSKQVALLERLLADAEVQHMTGELSEGDCKIAASSLKSGIDRALQEKRDVELDLEALQLLTATVEFTKQQDSISSVQQPSGQLKSSAVDALQPTVAKPPSTAVQTPSRTTHFVTSWRPKSQQPTEKEKEEEDKSQGPLILRL